MSFTMFSSHGFADGFYKWTDAHGNIQYGDEPPANARAKKMKMPAITVLKNYGEQWTQPKEVNRAIAAPIIAATASSAAEAQATQYTTLNFIAPKPNQVINAENGDVSAILSIKPPLKKGHSFRFMVDGKKTSEGRSRITNFLNLKKGSHSLVVNIVDGRGQVLQKSQELRFRVFR